MADVLPVRLSTEEATEYQRLQSIPALEDPWPTPADALRSARVAGRLLAEHYGPVVESAWLYGSRARGDHHEESDFDLLLVGDLPDHYRCDWRGEPLAWFFSEDHVYWVMIWVATSEQWHTWDTMFYRSVREDAIQVWPVGPSVEGSRT